MCSNVLLPLFTQYIENLLDLAETKNGTVLEILENIQEDLLGYINEESTACLDTDPVLNKLRELLQNTLNGALFCYLNQQWPDLMQLTMIVMEIRDELAARLEEVLG